MKLIEWTLTAVFGFFIALFVLLHHFVFHMIRLGRNVAHFFFRVIATVSLISCYFAFNGAFVEYGFESNTGYYLLGLSFVFSLLPHFYDKLIVKLLPEGETIYL